MTNDELQIAKITAAVIAAMKAESTAVEPSKPRLNAGPLKKNNPAPAAVQTARPPVKAPVQAQSEDVVQVLIVINGVTVQTLTSTGERESSTGKSMIHNFQGTVPGTKFKFGGNMMRNK